jgi:hypothetical protein
MSAKTQLRKYAVEWIENQATGKVFHLFDIYKYLETDFPEECRTAGITVSDGRPYHEFAARDAIRHCKIQKVIAHTRKGRWKEGYWKRI